MKADRSLLGWLIVGGVLLAGAVYMVVNWFEIADQRDWVGAEGEARTDPYLAMKRLLVEMGARTLSVKQASELDALPATATLLLGDRRLARMSPERVARLVSWVKAGGHLIVEAEQPRLDDPLLRAFGLTHIGLRWTAKGLRERRDDSGGEAADEDDAGADAETLPDTNDAQNARGPIKGKPSRGSDVSLVDFPDGARFKVVFSPYQNLRITEPRDSAFALRDKTGLRMVQFEQGEGRVTAISNFDFMTWRSIASHDHAEFVWRLVKGGEAAAANRAKPLLVLALRSEEGGLWKWLRDNAWMALWSLLALLLAWIVRVAWRFGPLLPELPAKRLSLGEHLRAMGRYVGRGHGWPALIRAARERFIARLQRERPGLHRVDGAALAAALENMTGLGAARIQRALYLEVNDRRAFADAVRTLKALEHILTAAPRTASRAATTWKHNQPQDFV